MTSSRAPAPRCPPTPGVALAALLAVLLLGGCGDERSGPQEALIEVVANPLDGEPPSHDLVLRPRERGASGPAVRLTPVQGRPRVYRASGLGEGTYELGLPDGWAQLSTSGPSYVQRDGRPARVSVGRPHTLYLTSVATGRPLGGEWAVRRVDAAGQPAAAVPVKVEIDGNAWVLLRLDPGEPEGTLVVQGRFEDRGLTQHFPFLLRPGSLPAVRQLEAEPSLRLRVAVVGIPAGAERWVHARVLGLPLDERRQSPVRDGAAEFPLLAASPGGVELRLGDGEGAATFRLPSEAWTRAAEVRLHDGPGDPERGARLALPAGTVVRGVQVRADDEDAYGAVPFRVEEGLLRLAVAPGAWRVLVQSASGWASGRVTLAADGTTTPAALGAIEAAASVQGNVVGGAGGTRLHWERLEDGRRVGGDGFVVAAGLGGAFEASLPAGDYEVTLVGSAGARSAPRRFPLEAGQHVNAAFDAPRPLPQEIPPGPR